MEGAFSNVRHFSSVLWLVASGASGVRERLALHSYEPPLIALRVEGELQDAIGLIIVDLAVGDGLQDGVVAPTPGAHHELPDATLRVRFPVGVLGRETLVVVLVSRKDHIRSRLIKCFPQRLQLRGAAVLFP